MSLDVLAYNLQHQAGDRDHWCRTADGGHPSLSAAITVVTADALWLPEARPAVQNAFIHGCAGRPARSRWCKSTTMKE